MKLLLKLNAMFLIGCGLLTTCAADKPSYKTDIDAILYPYVKDYYDLLHQHCPNGKYNQTPFHYIHLVPIIIIPGGPKNAIGVCDLWASSFEIEIDQFYWNTATVDDKRQLIYHEMSHCTINSEHVPDPHNYMYYQLNFISYEDLLSQTITNIEAHCNK